MRNESVFKHNMSPFCCDTRMDAFRSFAFKKLLLLKNKRLK